MEKSNPASPPDEVCQKILEALVPYIHRCLNKWKYFPPKAVYLSEPDVTTELLADGQALVDNWSAEVDSLRNKLAEICRQTQVIAGGYTYFGQSTDSRKKVNKGVIVIMVEQRNGPCWLLTQEVRGIAGKKRLSYADLETSEAEPHLFVKSLEEKASKTK